MPHNAILNLSFSVELDLAYDETTPFPAVERLLDGIADIKVVAIQLEASDAGGWPTIKIVGKLPALVKVLRRYADLDEDYFLDLYRSIAVTPLPKNAAGK
jgi:hypothetical protein